MQTANRFRVKNELGDVAEDFELSGLVRLPKRGHEAFELSSGYNRRLAKLQAAVILEKCGWSQQRIAVALGITTRHLRRRQGMIRAIAESQGRV